MASDQLTATLSPNEVACVTGIPLKQVNRIIDAGLLRRAASTEKRTRAIRREDLLGLKLAYETMDMLTLAGRRQLVRYLLDHPGEQSARVGDLSVDLRTIKGEVKKGLSTLAQAQAAVECNPSVLTGEPCIKGTRIPVHDIADMLNNGDSIEAIDTAYPHVSNTQIELAAFYARAYPRRGRPRREPFWRSRSPSESSETSLDHLLAGH